MTDKRQLVKPDTNVMCEKPQLPTPTTTDNTDCAAMVGPNFRVGKKIGCGNFGEIRVGKYFLRVMLCNMQCIPLQYMPWQF